jgi:APA family basic amino acid/polyamine antiporter
VTATLLLLTLAAAHLTGVRQGLRVHNAAVALKLGIILAFLILAWFRGSDRPPPAMELAPVPGQPGAAGVGAFAVALIWVSFSYSGWNAAVYVGGEIRDPERTLPRALLLGTLAVTGLYLLLNAVFLRAAPAHALAGRLDVAVVAAQAMGGSRFATWLAGLVAVALIAHVSALTFTGPRISARMAADGYLPSFLSMTAGSPRAALALQTVAALAMLWSATYDRLLTYIGFTLSLSTAATVVGLIRLRRREGSALRVPGWPWVPILFLVATLGAAAFSMATRALENLVGLGVILAGLVAWRLTVAHASRRQAHSRDPAA